MAAHHISLSPVRKYIASLFHRVPPIRMTSFDVHKEGTVPQEREGGSQGWVQINAGWVEVNARRVDVNAGRVEVNAAEGGSRRRVVWEPGDFNARKRGSSAAFEVGVGRHTNYCVSSSTPTVVSLPHYGSHKITETIIF